MENNSLSHWGIKGMKWGRRRYQNPDGSLTPEGKKRYGDDSHEDYRRAHDNKSIKQMSDKELQARNNRLQMEQNYKRLTQKTGTGKKLVNAFVSTAGTITAVAGAYATYKKFADIGIDKIGDWVVKGINLSGPVH
jgi:hypothetical protein